MPLLTPEQMEAFKARIGSQEQEQSTSAVEEAVQTQPKTEEKPYVREIQAREVEQHFDEEADDGHAVPYKRFKKVIESRNSLRNEIDKLRAEVESFKSQPRQTEQDYERSYKQAEAEYEDALQNLLDPSASKVKNLEDRLFAFEVAQEKVKLNQELEQVRNRFPDVPQQFVLEAVLKDPSVNVLDVAEQYSLFISQIEEQGIAKYVSRNGVSTERPAKVVPAVPTRVSGRSGAAADSESHFGGVEKPKTLKGAQAAVVQFLKSNWNK